jgi:hypothetical protein
MRTAGGIVIVALLLAGVASAADAPTRDQYRAQVNGVCQQSSKLVKKLNPVEVAALRRGDWAKAARIERQLDRQFARLITKIAVVPRPESDEALIARWLKAQRHQLRTLRRFARALDSGNVRRIFIALERARRADHASEAIIRGYGVFACEAN